MSCIGGCGQRVEKVKSTIESSNSDKFLQKQPIYALYFVL